MNRGKREPKVPFQGGLINIYAKRNPANHPTLDETSMVKADNPYNS
jgi:hypothetical protein